MAKKKTGRKPRGLVKGHLERIPSAAFDNYRRVITEMVGGQYGIYALYRKDRLYYVGLATDLRSRVKHHLKDRHAGKWTHFSLYLVRSAKHLKDLEALAMRIADPKGNRIRGRLPGAPDLRPLFRRKVTAEVMGKIREMMGGDGKPAKGTPAARKRAGKEAAETRKKRGKGIPLRGLLKNQSLRHTYKGKMYYGWILPSGRIKHEGKIYDTPSAAGKAVRGKTTNGWRFWRYKNNKGEWVLLKELRR